jgi:hypothetical protein
MSNGHLKRGSMNLKKATVSNMWKIAAIVEVQRVAKGATL